MNPYITVVMPVRNEARFIRQTLTKLVSQDYPQDKVEILVADGMSNDGTRAIVAELAQEHPQIQLLDNPSRLSSAGRNVGFRVGTGDYFLVVDGHCHIPSDKLLTHLADCFSRTGADCLGRPQTLDPPGLTPFQKAVALARGSRIGHGGDSLIYAEFEGYASPVSNGAAYSRRVFETVGYLDESFDAAEDVEFNYRIEQAGLKSYSSHKLAVQYYPRDTFRGLFSQMKRYGIGRRRFIGKHRQALSINQLIPALFTIGFGLLLSVTAYYLVTGKGEVAALALALPYLLYALLVSAVAAHVMLQSKELHSVLLPPIFLTIHLGLGFGFLWGCLNDKNRVRHRYNRVSYGGDGEATASADQAS